MKRNILSIVLLMLITSLGFSQVDYSGTVTDENGEPVIGATVRVQDTTIGGITDVNGNFTISGVNVGDVIIASYIGLEDSEHVVAAGESTFNFVLTQGANALEDVVIIGYGTVDEEDVTGSVTTVTSEDFNRGSVSSPQQLLQGKTAGVTITPGGAPGEGGVIRIRGGSSYGASNDPLIIIDDVPIDLGGAAGSRNILATLNPKDIESYTILKDASATAIYGSRASNGVIIITTKSGRDGDLKVGYSGLASMNTVTDLIDVWSADELRAWVNANGNTDQISYLGDANTDWQDAIFEDAFGTQHTISLSGGIDNLPYRASVGYDTQNGILRTSEFDRLSATLRLNPSFLENDALRLNVNAKYSNESNRFADRGAISGAIAMDPTQPIYDDSYPEFGGYYEWTTGATLAGGSAIPFNLATKNPVSALMQNHDEASVNRFIGNIKLDYDLPWLPGLTATVNAGLDQSNSDGSTFRPLTAATAYTPVDGYNVGGYTKEYTNGKTNSVLDLYAKYTHDFSTINTIFDITGGYSYQKFENEYDDTSQTLGNDLGDSDSSNDREPVIYDPAIDRSQIVLLSYFGRTNFNIAGKYILTGTVRRDGTSRFAEENRWGWFPAVSGAWKITEENFMNNSDLFSTLKFRAGWGLTGQQAVGGPYDYLARYRVTSPNANYILGGTPIPTYRPSGYNSTIKWEDTETINAGVDFGLWGERVYGSIDVYKKESSDLLSPVNIPAGTNFTNNLIVNIGDMTSQGVEFNLSGYPVDNESLSWESNFNVAYNEKELKRLLVSDNPDYPGNFTGGISGGTGNSIQINSVGYHPGTFYAFRQVYDQSGNPIQGVYVDLNKDGIINDSDRYRYENPDPDYTFGFSNNFYIGNFDLSFTMRASTGNYMYNNVASQRANYAGIFNVTSLNNVMSSVTDTNFESAEYLTDYYITDASFLKMDNIALGYDLSDLVQGVSHLKVLGTVNNVFTITDYEGIDPEIYGGIDNNFYPRSRIFSFGVNAEF